MNGIGDEETGESPGKLGSFYAYKNTFNENNIWVDVPRNGTYIPKSARSAKEIEAANSCTQ
jgi:hypothetical protein